MISTTLIIRFFSLIVAGSWWLVFSVAAAYCTPISYPDGWQDENLGAPTTASNQDSPSGQEDVGSDISEQKLPPLVDRFTPWLAEQDDLRDGIERAWEYRPYRVAVWICNDGSPQLTASMNRTIEQLNRRAELTDPSGWNLQIGEAPSQFRWQFLLSNSISDVDQDWGELPILEGYDKLTVVRLKGSQGTIQVEVQEYDLLTRQWGPLQQRMAADVVQLPAEIMAAIRAAFMPVTRIERVDVRGADTEIHLQVRAKDSSLRVELTEDKQWLVMPIADSPVTIQKNELFLPVVRRFDRDGKLTRIEPMEFTYLFKIGVSEIGEILCSFVSSQRAPLAGRKTRQAERLALVIRPPQSSSWLYMHTMDESQRPIEGIRVYSARPQDRDRLDAPRREPEFLGKTDWQGRIEIPPGQDGIRVLTVGRGARGGLMRLPLIPGLYPMMSTGIPDDETSLFAEGILQGFQAEVLNQVIQREVFETEILKLLENRDLEKAKSKFREYDSMESLPDVRNRLASERTALESLRLDNRQRQFIDEKFNELNKIITNQAMVSKKSTIQAKIQAMSNIPGASELLLE